MRLDETLTAKLLRERRHRISALEAGVKRRIMSMRNVMIAKWMSSADTSFRHIRGANMSFWRSDQISVNGLNEDFVGWGFEDHEILQA